MSLRIDGGYKKTATISDEQKIYELSQIWKDAEVTMKEALIIIDVQNDYFPGGSCELYRPLEAEKKIKEEMIQQVV